VARRAPIPLLQAGTAGLMALSSLRALRHRDYALLWAGGLVSNAGTWMQAVAVGALVVAETEQAVWAALVAVAAFLPIGVLSPVGGALADRLDRRRFIMAADTAEGLLAALLAVLAWTDRASPGVVTAVVFLSGCSSALRIPFQQSILPDVVPREDILSATSLSSAQYNLGRVVGPALAGVVIALGSYGLAFAVNALSFLAVVGALALVRVPRRTPADEGGMGTRIKAGARAALAEPGCRSAILLIGIVALLASPFIALVPAVADRLVDGEDALGAATGALTTAQGVGAVLGALLVVPLAERVGLRRVLVADLVLCPLALVAYGSAPDIVTAVVALTVVGALYIGLLSGLSTVVQLRAPEAYRGRVLSLYMVALGVVYPIGALLQGAVADVTGLPATTAGFALALVVVVVALAVLRPDVLAALGPPDDGSPPPPSAPAAPGAVAEAPEPVEPLPSATAAPARSER
jgi:MFS family permease